MSPTTSTPQSGLDPSRFFPSGNVIVPRFFLLAIALTLGAIAVDQFFAPILHTTSPLWATAACFLLVWRRGRIRSSTGEAPFEPSISMQRLVIFVAAHCLLILAARSLGHSLQAASGTLTVGGTLVAAWKSCVLIPTIVLFPKAVWKRIAGLYFPEAIAGLVVLFTFFPSRVLDTIWPWYGQVLGRCIYALSRMFVPGLAYLADSNPTLSGPDLDLTIIPACSGINGLELFDYLFGLVAFLDWNRIRKERALLGYVAGVLAMLLGNAIRISSFVVLGNRGFAETVARFHISAGWLFFSVVFLVYLFMTYAWMLGRKTVSGQPRTTA